ncbi:MAG: F0F1 ATP synthase subunit alpha, partial [Muribaculaceae bacterium]|nr:F0F1 ATP synthase subunit alpha [Muribaculaceae bacterium]
IKSMKKVAGTLKIDQAQFRELESFTKFGGDMDAVTARVIDKGRKNERLLIQPQYQPWPVEEQVAVIYCGTNGLLESVPMENVAEFQTSFLRALRANHQADVLDVIRGGQLTDQVTGILAKVASETAAQFARK